MKANFMVKVEDAKMVDVKKALEAAGIKVTSVQEIFKEGAPPKKAEEEAA